MIVKIFKISSMEMCVIPNKTTLIAFIESETNAHVPHSLTIKQLIKYLPRENYYRVK
jgi:hypothetical protein